MTATATDFSALTGTYSIDPTHSRFGFVARHAMVTKVRGQFGDLEGSVTLDGADPSKSSVSVTLQVASISTGNDQRDGHLRTNDFLDADTFPTITFASKGIAHVEGNDFEVTGDLTIKDVTKSVTLPLEFQGSATDPYGNQRIGFEGSIVINRTDYGVTTNVALETGGVLVGEKVTLEFDISAVKNA